MNFWKGKKIWIVGASSGIGEALVLELAKLEASILISARNESKLKELQSQSPSGKLEVLSLDVERHEELPALAEQAWKEFGPFDFVFLNAGMSVRDLVVNTQTSVEKKIMDINFWGPVVLTKSLLKLFQPENTLHLVVTSSLSGKYGVPKLAGYAASKHALHGYFDSLRAETAQQNLQIHLVIPGFVRTNITVAGLKGDGTPNGKMQSALAEGMDPLTCAKGILKGLQNGKEEFVVGGNEKYTVALNQYFPGLTRLLIRSNPIQNLKKLKSLIGIK